MSIIIPVYKDRYFAVERLQNILRQKYPKSFYEVILVNGGNLQDSVHEVNSDKPMIRIINTKVKGKVNQLNVGLEAAHGQVIIVTDADARFESDYCFKGIVKRFERQARLGVLGLWTRPGGRLWLERLYWWIANWHRWAESRVFSASHIVAPCFAFRKEVLPSWPDDCVADDVYISLYANMKGWLVDYMRELKVMEIRTPRSIAALYRHKNRKGNAFLRELLRFLYKSAYFPSRFKGIYLSRLIQFTFLTPVVAWNYLTFKQDSCYEKV